MAYGQWHFSKGKKSESVKVRGTLSSNDGAAVLTWSLEGHGVMMRSRVGRRPFVRSGQLEVLLDDYDLPRLTSMPSISPKQNLAAKVRVFVDFLAEYFAKKSNNAPGDPPLASTTSMRFRGLSEVSLTASLTPSVALPALT